MASDDILRRQIEELHGRIAELTDRLRCVTDERDAALRDLARQRGEYGDARSEQPEALVDPSGLATCTFCDGEGLYWVHDFEMVCKRCNGTGSAPRGSAEVAPDSR